MHTDPETSLVEVETMAFPINFKPTPISLAKVRLCSLLPIHQFQALKHPWLRLDNGLVAELKEAKVNTELMKRYTAR